MTPRRERAEPISLAEANHLLLDPFNLGLDAHYLGPMGFNTSTAYCLASAERDAVAVFRPLLTPAWNDALSKPLELTRLWRSEARGRPLSSFVSAALRYVRWAVPETDVVFAYTDPAARNSLDPGRAHHGGIYAATNFGFLGERRAMPHWIDSADGSRINTQACRRLLGTIARAKVAALKPSWAFVPGAPKLLFAYPLARTIDEVLECLNAISRSAASRPMRLAVQPPPKLDGDIADLLW